MQRLTLMVAVIVLWGAPKLSHAANGCVSESFMARVSSNCDPLLGHFSVTVLPNSIVSATAAVSSGQSGDIQSVQGIIRVARIIDRPCSEGCSLDGELPNSISVKITGNWGGGWLVRVNQAPPIGEENFVLTALYDGPGLMSFSEKAYTHSGDGSSQSASWYDTENTTQSLTIGDYPFSISLEGAVRADGGGGNPWSSFTSSLSVTAAINGTSTFEASCVPEPEAIGMSLAGLCSVFWLIRRRPQVAF